MHSRPSVLFINQHYWPDFASTAQHLTDLAEYLAGDGFAVHVLCSRGHYLAGSMDAPAEETRHGVRIHRVRATAFGRASTLGRLVDYGTFYAATLAKVLAGPSYDLIVTLTTPPLLPVAGAVAHRLRGQAYGIWSMDLHPDAEVTAGMLDADGGLARALHALNTAAYRSAAFVVDLGSHMKQRLLQRGLAKRRLHTIPVWSRKDEIFPVAPAENPLRGELGLEGKFVVMYSGNAGLAHRFDEVLAVIKRLDGHPHIRFLFVGAGPRKEEIEAFADAQKLSNFQYRPYFPREALKHSLSLADVHLLTLRAEMAGIAVPGKLYGIMAAGRPALMVGPEASESAETIRAHEAGAVVDPSTRGKAAQELYEALLCLYNDEEARARLGANGRRAFLDWYERDVNCEAWAALLRAQDRTRPHTPAQI